jgi:hypothetical protein
MSLALSPVRSPLGVIGVGLLGSEPDIIPRGRLLMIFAISNKTVCNSIAVQTWLPIVCLIVLFVDLISDSLTPFWCCPSAGANVHLIFLSVQNFSIFDQSHEASSAISFAAANSCDP